ncbi:hypothetical protein PAPYR_9933 [Paratrimastix pyriformis]|uniref:Uncharacterized protein n=1 Tax=Paratrimastix pyriformis TaxID=342808 RepID=A0ABQ8U784_9EUKA|nr:hypothetical protein PAPYR_9933 [Paratrimastix pyriformis]
MGRPPSSHRVGASSKLVSPVIAQQPEYYYTAPSWETRRHGTRAPSGTDSLALEAMSEGPLIQHSSSALIGNA